MENLISDKERIEDIKKRWFSDGQETLPIADISWLIIKVEKEENKKEIWLERMGYQLESNGDYVFKYNNNWTHTFTDDIVNNLDVGTLEKYHDSFLKRMEWK